MWIESHVDLGEHPKIFQLCYKLQIRKPEAIGLLHSLWHFTMKFAWRDGDLRRFTPSSIVMAIDWRGDADVLFGALHECGWMDADMKIHDWMDYAGKVVRDRLYNEKRRNTPLNDDTSRKTAATIPYPTLPDQHKTNGVGGPPPAPEGPTASSLLDLWNRAAHPNLPRAKELNETRKRAATARLKDHPDKKFWLDLMEKINRSPLLTGQKNEWRCSFDWILSPTNLTKITEGNYDGK